LIDSTPVKAALSHFATSNTEIFFQEISKPLDESIIELSSSKYAIPMLLVAKVEKFFRAVFNYLALITILK
jgi:hypothetical protein